MKNFPKSSLPSGALFSHTRLTAISNARLKIHFVVSRRLTFSEIKIKKVSVTTYLTAEETSFRSGPVITIRIQLRRRRARENLQIKCARTSHCCYAVVMLLLCCCVSCFSAFFTCMLRWTSFRVVINARLSRFGELCVFDVFEKFLLCVTFVRFFFRTVFVFIFGGF